MQLKNLFSQTLGLFLLLLVAMGAKGADKPNILFIFTDDHATHALSAYGSKINETPNLDRLAREGMLFQRCLVTNSICGPSRAVVLTGKHSHLNGFVGNSNTFNGSQQTAPKLLREAGYETAIIGKWHLKSTPTGFDHFDVLLGQGKYYNTPTRTTNAKGEVVTIQNKGYTTDLITDKALAWLKEERSDKKPFFLMYQHKAPHGKWEPAPRHFDLYADMDIAEPETLFDDYVGRASGAADNEMSLLHSFGPDRGHFDAPPGLSTEEFAAWHRVYDPENLHSRWTGKDASQYGFQMTREKTWDADVLKKWNEAFIPRNRELVDKNLTGDDLVRWKYQRYIKNYLRCVTAVDENVGRVLDYLDESGLAENTVVIYSSDQGFYLGDHGWFDKRWIYEPSLRSPLLVRWPGVAKAGSENGDIVSNLDFAETFLDIAGVPQPEDMQGESLVPLLKGETPEGWRDSFYYHYYEGDVVNPKRGGHNVPRHYGVVTGRHKLVHYYQLDEWELFDLKADPNELESRYDNSDYREVQFRLKKELKRLREEYKVPAKDPPGAGV